MITFEVTPLLTTSQLPTYRRNTSNGCLGNLCPIGPWIVSHNELDPENLDITCFVNGELRRNANTRDLIFDIPTIIETISASMTLMPGDIIATGAPAGVGIGFDPPKFLSKGDEIEIKISGIGTIKKQRSLNSHPCRGRLEIRLLNHQTN